MYFYSLHFLNLLHDYQPEVGKCSQQILPDAPPAVRSEPGSWQMLASAVILVRCHRTRSHTGNSELTSSHLLITHTHQAGSYNASVRQPSEDWPQLQTLQICTFAEADWPSDLSLCDRYHAGAQLQISVVDVFSHLD